MSQNKAVRLTVAAGGIMLRFAQIHTFLRKFIVRIRVTESKLPLVAILLLVPMAARAQGSPFDNGFTALQTLFTGTVAKVASLIAIVIGGYAIAVAARTAHLPLLFAEPRLA